MPEGRSLKTVLTFIWTAILSFLAFPVTVAGYLFDKRMSIDVKTTNNNETKIDNGEHIELSEEEVEQGIKFSWNVIWPPNDKKQKKDNGIAFFITFFELNPAALDYFEAFKDVDRENIQSLKGNPKLAAHAHSVMCAINSYIDNMDDPEMLANLLKGMLRRHKPRGVGAKQIRWLIGTMHTILDVVLGNDSTPKVKQAWTCLFEKIATIAENPMD